jgi:hypothetical protein
VSAGLGGEGPLGESHEIYYLLTQTWQIALGGWHQREVTRSTTIPEAVRARTVAGTDH